MENILYLHTLFENDLNVVTLLYHIMELYIEWKIVVGYNIHKFNNLYKYCKLQFPLNFLANKLLN